METTYRKKLGFSRFQIHTDIVINATTDQVWDVLTDTATYADWAAFMVDLQGPIKDGATITAGFQLNPDKDKTVTIDHKIHVIEGVSFHWQEPGPGGICDNHHFRVERTGNGNTRFVQHDELSGGLTWLAGGYLSKLYLRGYQAFNHSLRDEVNRRLSARAA